MAEYTIQKGDTLTKIAKKYNTSVSALAAANNISNPDKIRAGAVLQIGEPAPVASAAPSPAASAAPSTTPAGVNSELWSRAESLYQPSYNAAVNQINTEAQKKQTELERLIALANDTYANYKNEIDTQLATAIKKSDQSISDEMVKRGLSRSTYALDRQAQATATLIRVRSIA